MSIVKEEYIIKFLLSRGWSIEREGNLFIYLKPNNNLIYPDNFKLEIPKFTKTT